MGVTTFGCSLPAAIISTALITRYVVKKRTSKPLKDPQAKINRLQKELEAAKAANQPGDPLKTEKKEAEGQAAANAQEVERLRGELQITDSSHISDCNYTCDAETRIDLTTGKEEIVLKVKEDGALISHTKHDKQKELKRSKHATGADFLTRVCSLLTAKWRKFRSKII